MIGVGGIEHSAHALDFMRAGADLVQLYTGFIYEGPNIAFRIARELALSLLLPRPRCSLNLSPRPLHVVEREPCECNCTLTLCACSARSFTQLHLQGSLSTTWQGQRMLKCLFSSICTSPPVPLSLRARGRLRRAYAHRRPKQARNAPPRPLARKGEGIGGEVQIPENKALRCVGPGGRGRGKLSIEAMLNTPNKTIARSSRTNTKQFHGTLRAHHAAPDAEPPCASRTHVSNSSWRAASARSARHASMLRNSRTTVGSFSRPDGRSSSAR